MSMKVILVVFLLGVGSFVVNSVNMKKISCSEILKCSVKNAYNSITKIPLLEPSTYISSFKNAFLNDGTISWSKVNENRFQQKAYYRTIESVSAVKLKHHRIKYFRSYDPLIARSSRWYLDYVAGIDKYMGNTRKSRKFRRRFRMPAETFRDFMIVVREENWFPYQESCDAIGNMGLPLDTLVLGCLRYLGRGWTFDDLEESTGISEESHRRFFHKFVKECRDRLGKKYIVAPETKEEVEDCMAEFTEAGKLFD